MRVCDLAKELKTTSKELLQMLQAHGSSVKSVQTNITQEHEDFLRAEIQRIYYTAPAAAAPVAATEAPAATPATPAAENALAPEANDADASAAPAAEAPAPAAPAEKQETPTIFAKGHIVIRDLAEKMGVKPNRLVAALMKQGTFASLGDRVEFKVAATLAEQFGFRLEKEPKAAPPPPPPPKKVVAEEPVEPETPADSIRPPVVTFMGHVDHGKTSLLDYIRKAHVVAGEDGGITQHIGAYTAEWEGRKITFLDTPGHEAFNAMRERGAQLADIAVIVIAADDGVMPQTKEAIAHAKESKVTMIVAINKCDKHTANPDRVKRQLQQMGVNPEDWGGDVICCNVSAQTGDGIPNLLEMILLQADMLELKASSRGPARGYVIEARLEAGMGPTASVLVKDGTLKVNDAVVSGTAWGTLKALIDDKGKRQRTAGPSTAVKIMGLSDVPTPGDEFRVYPSKKEAQELAESRIEAKRLADLRGAAEKEVLPTSLTNEQILEQLLAAQPDGGGKPKLSVILKTDVVGSIEAIEYEWKKKLRSEKVDLEVLSASVGDITLKDVQKASAAKAVILGFHVAKANGVVAEAKRQGVLIRLHSIIYEMTEDCENMMRGLLAPITKERINGHAVIRQIFDMGKRGRVAGCMCSKGKITLKGRIRVKRKDDVLYEGRIQSMRRFQNEATEVREGQECGIVLDRGFGAFTEGDIIESYESESIKQEL
ncbi:MAG: translation initiation factor IF-2 [Kiritimatiellae bacterium]|nr:translation initiation factor IF-2 [Kiritimatiellia bacterium]